MAYITDIDDMIKQKVFNTIIKRDIIEIFTGIRSRNLQLV